MTDDTGSRIASVGDYLELALIADDIDASYAGRTGIINSGILRAELERAWLRFSDAERASVAGALLAAEREGGDE